ncbi:MAG: hypothetical protein IT265_04690 [Saprospiraceae bacterium]|nr:hypothetical protein [Saprospiraceae bacterium]
MRNFIEELDHFKAIFLSEFIKLVDGLNIQSMVLKTCLMFFLLFNFGSQVIGQPVVKKGPSLVSKLHPHTEDWPLAMISGSDCLHIYFDGFTECEGDSGGDCPDHRRLPVMGCFDKNTGTLVWEKEYEFFPGFATVYGNFTAIYEENGYLWGTGGVLEDVSGSNYWRSFIVKADISTGIPEPGYPKLIAVSQTGGMNSSSRIFSTAPIINNGVLEGFISSGEYHGFGAGIATKQAMIVKLLADGTLDNSWGNNKDVNGNPSPNGAYFGPVGSSARTVITVQGSNNTKFAFTGFQYSNNNSPDINGLIIGLNEMGTIETWSREFQEGMNGYVDIDANNDKSLCACPNGEVINSSFERGYDIIQNGDNEIYVSAYFDDYEGAPVSLMDINKEILKEALCEQMKLFNLDYYLDVDAVILKVNKDNGEIMKSLNVDHYNGSDFQLDLEIKNGFIYMLGVKSKILPTNCNSPYLSSNTAIAKISPNLDIVWKKEFNATNPAAKINCSFAIAFDCDNNLLVTGNNELNDEDYYFYTLSNECQSSVQLGGNDIISKTIISGNTTWSSSRKVKATIIIPAGAQLRIDNNAIIEFGAAWELVDYNILANNTPANDNIVPKIIVMDGGTLTIDHATLKGFNACSHDWMWEGIELRKGGHVMMSNNALIEDAKIGILVDRGAYNSNGNFNPTETDGGGVITSSNSTFKNCRRCIHFANSSLINTSSLTNTHFINDQGLKDPQYKSCYVNQNILPIPPCSIIQLGTNQFVTAYNIKGMNFSTCEWLNSRIDHPAELKGVGIGSFDADYQVNGGSSFTDLNIGIQALKALNPKFFISVSGSNQFIRNQIGIRINGGELHKIVDGNNFELNPSTAIPVNLGNPTVFGIVNTGSTKITVKGNTFDGKVLNMPQNTSKYGFNSDNTVSASFHLNNTFTKLFMGEQTQRDNTGLNLYCNTHLLYTNSWRVFGKLGDQGKCGFLQINNITPDDKFNVPCLGTQLNHINSYTTNPFTYWIKPSDPEQPNCNSTKVSKSTCNSFPPPAGGCTFIVPDIIPGNVVEYRTQIDGMDDGPFKSVIINELLRYYFKNNLTEDADNLLATQTSVDNKFTRAMLLLDQGNFSGATAVINSIPSNSDEKADMITFFNVISVAKQSNISMTNLSESAIASLESITDNRTLGAYSAQALLTAFYDHQYPIVLETEDGLQYRSNSEPDKDQIVKDSYMSIDPSPIDDICMIKFGLIEKLINAKIRIYSIEGILLDEVSISSPVNQVKLDSKLWPSAVFTAVLINDNKIVVSLKSVKN